MIVCSIFLFKIKIPSVKADTTHILGNSEDPILGWQTKFGTAINIRAYILASSVLCTEVGTADSITAYIYCSFCNYYPTKVKCAIYDFDYMLITNGVTEEKTISTPTDGWVTFNFIGTKPNLTVQTYYLAVWSETQAGPCQSYYSIGQTGDVGYTIVWGLYAYNSFPSTIWGLTVHYHNARASIYCSYTQRDNLVTYYMTEGGKLVVNFGWSGTEAYTRIEIPNGTVKAYPDNEVIELLAVPQNSSYIFQSFNWTGGSSTSNPYNYTVTGTMTVWCYFDETPTGDGLPYIVARFTFSPSNPLINQNINFNGSGSESSETISSYSWDFGDGGSSGLAEPTYSYSSIGTYSVILTVTSVAGSDSFTQQITVSVQQQAPSEERGGLAGNYKLSIIVTYNEIPCSAKVDVEGGKNLSLSKEADFLGKASFVLPMGIYEVKVTYEDETKEDKVNLRKDSELSFKFKGKKKFPTEIGLLIIFVIIVVGILWIYPDLMPKKAREKIRRHKRREKPRKHKSTVKPRKHKRRK